MTILQGLDNAIFMDNESDIVESSYDEELLAALIRQDLESCLSPGHNSSSSSCHVNVPSTTSMTSLYTSPNGLENEQHLIIPPENINPSPTPINNGAVTMDQASSAPIILNFGNSNNSENLQQVRPDFYIENRKKIIDLVYVIFLK